MFCEYSMADCFMMRMSHYQFFGGLEVMLYWSMDHVPNFMI